MKDFISKKGPGFYLMAADLIFVLLGIIAYAQAGQDSFGFVPAVVVLLVVAFAAGLVCCWKDFFECGSLLVAILICLAFGYFINDRYIYYAHLYFHIASEPITGAMVVTTVAFIGMLVISLVGPFFDIDKQAKKGEIKA
jgi:hypothetical protein